MQSAERHQVGHSQGIARNATDRAVPADSVDLLDNFRRHTCAASIENASACGPVAKASVGASHPLMNERSRVSTAVGGRLSSIVMSAAPSPFSFGINLQDPQPPMSVFARQLKDPDRYLFVLGSTHDDADPSSPKYELAGALLDEWKRLTAHDPENRLVLYEGRSPAFEFDLKASIERYTEPGFLKSRARSEDLPAESAEISHAHESWPILGARRKGDGVVDNAEDILSAVIGVRFLPFIHLQVRGMDVYSNEKLDVSWTRAYRAFMEYMRTDGRFSIGYDDDHVEHRRFFRRFSELFERYFDTPLVITDFEDPDCPLIQKCRAITEPDRFRHILADNPKLATLAASAHLLQMARTRGFGHRLYTEFDQGRFRTPPRSVFFWVGFPHLERLSEAFARVGNAHHIGGIPDGLERYRLHGTPHGTKRNAFPSGSISLNNLRLPPPRISLPAR